MILYMGLGRMGLPMALHAMRTGQDVEGHDPSPERQVLFAREGGRVVRDVSDALARAQAVVVIVGSEAQAAAIVLGPDGVAGRCAPGTLLLMVSTVSPDFIARMQHQLTDRGIRVVDAPVCRAEMGAIQGTLLTFLAGDPGDCQAATEIMRPYSSDMEIVGTRPGAAQVAKTVNNMILWACAVANEEGLRLASTWQLDQDALRRALVTSSADNWCLRHWAKIDEMPWSIKDMEIAVETARQSGVGLPLADLVERLVRTSPVLSHA